MADIFVSYTRSDREWAFWIGKELKKLGHRPHIYEWEIKGGDDIYAWMEAHHDAADHVLCVLSDEYLKAPYSTLERHAALWQAVSKRPGFALLVAVKSCKLPTLSDHIRRCELFGVPEDAARTRFREFMEKPKVPETIAFPGEGFAVSNITMRVPKHFMGRDDSLTQIEDMLKCSAGRVAVTTLHGLRGVGKSTVAVSYAELHRSAYRATWWIRAQTEPTMRADLVALGIRLRWVAEDDKEDVAFEAVMERLRHEGEGLLIIFDNAPDADALKPYLPRGGAARVLVTSNTHAWRGVAEPVEIDVWSKEIGAEYLIARTGRSGERASAENLSEALGGLPLAHEQAAAYCEDIGIGLDEYKRRFESAPLKFLDDKDHAPSEYHDKLTVARTFSLGIEEAAKRHPAAEALIVHAALLAPEPIPLFLFSEARKKFGGPLASALSGDGLDKAVAALRAFALVQRETIMDDRDPSIRMDAIRLHRLVREVAATRRADQVQEQLRHTLAAALTVVYPKNSSMKPASWSRCAPLTPHLIAICETKNDILGASLLLRAGDYFYGRAAFSTARPLLERALAINEKVVGAEHPETATSLNNLGCLLRDLADQAGAQPLLERALEIREKVVGAAHPATASTLNNLAGLIQDRGDFARAQPLFERALAINEKVLGPDHPRTMMSVDNLATLLRHRGDHAGALPLYKRALASAEKVFGAAHPATITILNNLASLIQYQGDLVTARPLLERAVAINEKVVGAEHPATATSLNNLAGLLYDMGDFEEALPRYARALEINEKVRGAEHPETATSLNNLACLLQRQGDIAGAQRLFERALQIREEALGPEHPLTAESLRNLAGVLRHQGDIARAQSLTERSLAIRRKRPVTWRVKPLEGLGPRKYRIERLE